MAKPKQSSILDVMPDSTNNLIPKFHSPQIAEVDETVKKLADQIHGDTKDVFMNDFIAPFKDIQIRLQKVEEINNRLKRERNTLMYEVDRQKIEIMQLKRANEHLLEGKSKMDEHLQEQHVILQENSCLKEETAKTNIENLQLKQELADMRSEMNKIKKKMTQLQNTMTTDGNASKTSSILENMQRAMARKQGCGSSRNVTKQLKQLSSPFFPPLNLAEMSAKLLSQCTEEKKELELQCQQMIDFQNNHEGVPLSNTPSEYSLLGFETAEADEIKATNECLQNMMETKQDLVFINFNLKYLLHLLSRKPEQGLSSSGSDHQAMSEDEHSSDIVSDGINSESSRSKFKPRWKTSSLLSQQKATETSPDSSANSSGKMTSKPFVPSNLPHKADTSPNNFLYSKPAQQTNDYEPFQPPVPYWHYNKSSDLQNRNMELIVNNVTFVPNFCRSDSAEGNVGSPPQMSTLLSPDSLSIESVADLMQAGHNVRDATVQSGNPTSPTDNDDDRICPMCQAQFPKFVSQKDFEAHVVSHFEVEEFELI